MSAIHVIVRPHPQAPPAVFEPLRGLFDVVVDGVNVTARVGEAHAIPVLTELARAVASLASGRRQRATVQLEAEQQVWELGLEADGADALLTVFRSGPAPEVAVYERRVSLESLRSALENALREVPADGTAIESARRLLESTEVVAREPLERTAAEIAPRACRGVAFWAKAELRRRPAAAEAPSERLLERADLHALLARGECGFNIRERSIPLGPVHLFLLAERLLALAEDALGAFELGKPLFRRIDLPGVRIALQRGPGDQPMSLGIGPGDGVSERVTFPEIEPAAFARAALRFSRALVVALVDADPSQSTNLRLKALEAQMDLVAEQVDDVASQDSLRNAEPDSYRSYSSPPRPNETSGRWEHGGKMRFLPRWVATVPAIDLRGTFLCGDRLIIGSERETACIHRSTGMLLWRVPTARAACVATPLGIARLSPEGRLTLHDLDDGQARFSLAMRPRAGGGASGAVVHSPGLPKLLVVSEGDRQITAIDLVTGDIRWRHTLRRPGSYRMRRAGKLLLVAGESVVVALDVASGEVVWRVRDRLPFTGDIAVDHDSAFAITAGTHESRLLHLDPWTGEVRWNAEIDERPSLGQPPLVGPNAVAVPVRDCRGSGLCAFSRSDGRVLWSKEPGLSAPATAWLAVDRDLVGNSAAGTLLSIDGETGAMRFNHVFPRHVDADQPRRLEPVLRSGALFVPQHQVHVVRPRDGEILGTVPTDLIPDLVRVDERCDVYVAEESGHIAGFGVAARLTLVK